MTTPYDPDANDGDPDGPFDPGSPSVAEMLARAKAARADATRMINYMVEKYGDRGIAVLLNVIDEMFGTHSDVILERRQVEDFAFEQYNLYAPELWENLVDSDAFRSMLASVRDYTAECVPRLVWELLQEEEI